MKPRPLFALMLVALVLSGCALRGASSPAQVEVLSPEVARGFAEDAAGFAPPMEAGRSDFSGNVVAADAERLVIQNAYLTLVVEDPAASAEEISRLAESMGGFVVTMNIYQSAFGEAQVVASQGTITIRVPSERLDEALSRIEEQATEVRSRNLSGEDVTSQYTDLESRLRNLEAAEEQLREIMGSAVRTEDVLMIFNQLTQVRGEIEMVRGQMRYYEESARLSAISVELIPDVAAQPIQIGGWRPDATFKEAIEDLVRALQFLADLGIRGAVCVLPVALVLGLPLWAILRLIIRRRRASRPAAPAE